MRNISYFRKFGAFVFLVFFVFFVLFVLVGVLFLDGLFFSLFRPDDPRSP